MGRKKRFKVRQKQRQRRRKRLCKLREKNQNIGDYFSDGRYIGPHSGK